MDIALLKLEDCGAGDVELRGQLVLGDVQALAVAQDSGESCDFDKLGGCSSPIIGT